MQLPKDGIVGRPVRNENKGLRYRRAAIAACFKKGQKGKFEGKLRIGSGGIALLSRRYGRERQSLRASHAREG